MKKYSKADINILDYAYRLRKEDPIAVLPCPIKNGRIHPGTTRIFYKNGQMDDVMDMKPIYYETLEGAWRPMNEVTYGFGNHWLNLKEDWDTKMSLRYLQWLLRRMEIIGGSVSFPFPKIGFMPIREGKEIMFTTTTLFPDADVESSSVDGIIRRNSVDESFATIIAGVGVTALPSESNGTPVRLVASTTTDQYAVLSRFWGLFDGSAISGSDTIDTVVFSLWFTVEGNGLSGEASSNSQVVVVASTPASDTDLVTADFVEKGTTEFGTSGDQDSLTTNDSAYTDITLNSSGRTHVATAADGDGIIKLATLYRWDFGATVTGLTWSSAGSQSLNADFADIADTSSDPKLVVTHSAVTHLFGGPTGVGIGSPRMF